MSEFREPFGGPGGETEVQMERMTVAYGHLLEEWSGEEAD